MGRGEGIPEAKLRDLHRVAESDAFSEAEVDAELARDLLDDYFDIESDMLRIRKRYVRRFQAVIPAMKVTRFYQLENKLDAEVDAELAATMPLFDPM